MTSRWMFAGWRAAGFALCIAWLVCRTQAAAAGSADGQLEIYWIDVEGGAATLMVTPRGESVLVDTGNPGRRDPQRIFDVAAKVAGLRKIDYLVTTHFHRDHFGGAATLAALLPIGVVYDNGEFEGGVERPDQDYLSFAAQRRAVIEPGQEIPLKQSPDKSAPRLSLRCLAARQQFAAAPDDADENAAICQDARAKARDGSDNANSIVLLLSLGEFQFFDGGDLTWNMEQKLVCPKNLVGEVDVYQTTHHGLDASNNPLVIRSLKPKVAVFNNGVTKGCEPDVFAALQREPSVEAVYQMHRNLRSDSQNNVADEYIANLEKECQANYIRLAVDPAAGSYTVSIPARGHERTFAVK
ncbi:MAG TPA: MBL fold metallo-hydrolase [Pirellulales bacterium]|nr:MBL fold metallo-hydrolase [Pirellulales bacterium]